MTTTSFQYRSYAVGEIAVLYFPSISPGSATRNLSRYINLDEDLLARLRAHGYAKASVFSHPRWWPILWSVWASLRISFLLQPEIYSRKQGCELKKVFLPLRSKWMYIRH